MGVVLGVRSGQGVIRQAYCVLADVAVICNDTICSCMLPGAVCVADAGRRCGSPGYRR
jgi:hypothetical protein